MKVSLGKQTVIEDQNVGSIFFNFNSILPVVFRQQIDVVKDETSKVVDPKRLDETDVHQSSSVERFLSGLLDDEESIVELLTLQDRVEVVKERPKMFLSISEKKFLIFVTKKIFLIWLG